MHAGILQCQRSQRTLTKNSSDVRNSYTAMCSTHHCGTDIFLLVWRLKFASPPNCGTNIKTLAFALELHIPKHLGFLADNYQIIMGTLIRNSSDGGEKLHQISS